MSGRLKPQKKSVESGAKTITLKLSDGTEIFVEIRVTALAVKP